MALPQKAMFAVMWTDNEIEFIQVLYNPTELSFDKSLTLAEIQIPGLDAPLQQFVRGQAEKLTVELFFDSTEDGMGEGAHSVTEHTDQIFQLMKIEPSRHAPPVCAFMWNAKFPGSDLSDRVGNQRRNDFQCIVENVKQKFTLFSPEGVPLRATLTVTMREYRTLDEQLSQLNLNSPDRTQNWVIRAGDTLTAVAGRHYRRPQEWRLIADANGIEDPRRISVGRFLRLPPTSERERLARAAGAGA
jgi:hypothetical protein